MVLRKDQLLLLMLNLDNSPNAFGDIGRAQDGPKNAQHAHINTRLQVHTHTYTQVHACAPNEYTRVYIYVHIFAHVKACAHKHMCTFDSSPLRLQMTEILLIFLESFLLIKTQR